MAPFCTGCLLRGVWYLVRKHFWWDLRFWKNNLKFAPAAPAVCENVYAYIVKKLQFWSDFAQIRDCNPFGSQMKNSWKGLASHAPRARSAWKHLRLFSEKSAILVRFRSNSGLEPLWIPYEEFMKGAYFARARSAQKSLCLFIKNPQFWSDFAQIRYLNPFWSHLKNSWNGLASRARHAPVVRDIFP